MKDLEKLLAEKEQYDKESQEVIASLSFAEKEVGQINSMKQTEGWKILDKKIREELQQRINDLVKDDKNVITLLALLYLTDTKSLSKKLEEEISKILPE